MRDPRHILITGASSGLGAALALDYASAGVILSLHGRNPERLAAVAAAARARGAVVEILCGDVRDRDTLATWIAARDQTNEIDLVIANAGISPGTLRGAENASQERVIFDINLTGVLNTLQPLVPAMRGRGRGQMAIISSLASFRGFAGTQSYSASKAAVRVYGEGLRAELAAYNVEVNVVCPGFIKTPMTDVNPFPMPFIISAEQAATIIRNRLARNHARIAFPWVMYAVVLILAALPQQLMDFIAARLPRK